MRSIILCIAVLLLAAAAFAQSLESTLPLAKPAPMPTQHPGTPDGREGGETIETAIEVNLLPFIDSGNTTDNLDDYDETCPYPSSTSPDVVYRWFNQGATTFTIDLCGSSYDTKLYVYDADLNVVACNDDFYEDTTCGMYVSRIDNFTPAAGIPYYIVVDGYGGDAGDYQIEMQEIMIHPPCELDCDGGLPEGEPPLDDGYVDSFNSGCGGPGETVFTDLVGDGNGELVFCGHSGWYESEGSTVRDTDWFTAMIGPMGLIEWSLIAELDTYGFLLSPTDCADVAITQTIEVAPCETATMSIQGKPGDLVWLWVGPTTFEAPGYAWWTEYLYISTFSGLEAGPVSTEGVSFGHIKSLYR